MLPTPSANLPKDIQSPARMSRRALVGGMCCAIVAFAARRSFAATPSSATYTFKHGEFDITVISDGHLMIPRAFLAPGIPKDQLETILLSLGQTEEMVAAPTNVTLIRTKSELILVDAGAGAHFMPTAGKLASNLTAVGINPDAVTKVVYTHGHPDHLWGTVDELDELAFPNASYVIAAAEWNLWMGDDVLAKLPADRQNFATGARRSLKRIKDKIATIGAGEDVAPGIRAIATPGHTQGHIAIEIVSANDALVVLGDALTHPVISFAHPAWRPAADHDPEQAVVTRNSLLGRLASDRSRIIGYHLPFPGLGLVERNGLAFRYTAAV